MLFSRNTLAVFTLFLTLFSAAVLATNDNGDNPCPSGSTLKSYDDDCKCISDRTGRVVRPIPSISCSDSNFSRRSLSNLDALLAMKAVGATRSVWANV